MKKRILPLALALLLALTVAAGPAAAAETVQRSAQTLKFNGSTVDCDKYNIDGYNYFKLRDLAAILSGTMGQFDVGWDADRGLVTIVPGAAYAGRTGTELQIGEDLSATAVKSPQTVVVGGAVRSDFSVYNIGGNNYFKLRDLATVLTVTVDYDAATNTAILTAAAIPASGSDLSAPAEAGLRMRTDSARVVPGGTVTVRWSGVSAEMLAAGAWIGLARSDMSSSEYIAYHYLEGADGAAAFTAPASPGAYELRFYRLGYTGDDSLMKDLSLTVTVSW